MLQWEKSIPRPPAGERRQPPMECGIVTVDLHPQVKRLLRSPDGGATDLVLREMTE